MAFDLLEYACACQILLAPHICKEDTNLLPSADDLLASEPQPELLAEINSVHRERFTALSLVSADPGSFQSQHESCVDCLGAFPVGAGKERIDIE